MHSRQKFVRADKVVNHRKLLTVYHSLPSAQGIASMLFRAVGCAARVREPFRVLPGSPVDYFLAQEARTKNWALDRRQPQGRLNNFEQVDGPVCVRHRHFVEALVWI